MGNVNRWLKYAKAKLDSTVKSSNEELDRAEARLEADRADKPWLGADGDAPTLDEARARIRWEAEEAAKANHGAAADQSPSPAPMLADPTPAAPATPAPRATPAAPATPATPAVPEPPAAPAAPATPAAPSKPPTPAAPATADGSMPSEPDGNAPTGGSDEPSDGPSPTAEPATPPTPAGTVEPAAPTALPVIEPGPFDPATPEEAAERSNAQIELEQRARESAERLEQIRRELGVDPPDGPGPGRHGG